MSRLHALVLCLGRRRSVRPRGHLHMVHEIVRGELCLHVRAGALDDCAAACQHRLRGAARNIVSSAADVWLAPNQSLDVFEGRDVCLDGEKMRDLLGGLLFLAHGAQWGADVTGETSTPVCRA